MNIHRLQYKVTECSKKHGRTPNGVEIELMEGINPSLLIDITESELKAAKLRKNQVKLLIPLIILKLIDIERTLQRLKIDKQIKNLEVLKELV